MTAINLRQMSPAGFPGLAYHGQPKDEARDGLRTSAFRPFRHDSPGPTCPKEPSVLLHSLIRFLIFDF